MTPNHTKYIVGSIVIVVLACVGCGTYLLATGFQSGELLIGIASAGTGALGGMVASRPSPPHSTEEPVNTKIVNTADDPAITKEVSTQTK